MPSDVLQIVIPLAGLGSRFSVAGFADPKPFVKVLDRRMISLVLSNLAPKLAHKFILVCRAEHMMTRSYKEAIYEAAPDATIVQLSEPTDGAARTVLAAEDAVDMDAPMIIANSDQYLTESLQRFAHLLVNSRDLDGLIMTMRATGTKWSYARVSSEGLVEAVEEKVEISMEATAGVYGFREAALFFSHARAMIQGKALASGEYYVAPVYNEMIRSGAKVAIDHVGEVGKDFFGLGTPEDLAYFLESEAAERYRTQIGVHLTKNEVD